MNKLNKYYDIVIVGGGIIGSGMVIGLAKMGWNILLIERFQPIKFDAKSKPDLRVSAINYGTMKIIKKLGAWNNILNMRLASYKTLEIWETEKYSHIIFEANSIGINNLGYIIENRILQLALWKEFKKYNNLTVSCPNDITKIDRKNDIWEITLFNHQIILTHLIIGADGSNSQVRKLTGIKNKIHTYTKLCMLLTVKTKKHQNITWQEFSSSGPRAFLPLFNNWACLVLYDNYNLITKLKNLTLDEIKYEIIKIFPKRLGSIEIINKDSFNFNSNHVYSYINEGLVLIGDAAHTINPIAGQGINLGYRDVDTLLKVISESKNKTIPFYKKQTLINYQYQRILDNKFMQNSLHIIYNVFTSESKYTKNFREKMLNLIKNNNFIKQIILKYALGIK